MNHLEAKNIIRNRILELVSKSDDIQKQITNLLNQKEDADSLIRSLSESVQVLVGDEGKNESNISDN